MSYQAASLTATIQATVSDALGAHRPPDTVHQVAETVRG